MASTTTLVAVRSLRSVHARRSISPTFIVPEHEPSDYPQSIKADFEAADTILELARTNGSGRASLRDIPAHKLAGALGVNLVWLHSER